MFQNILTIYTKEFRQLKRDKLTLTAIIFTPMLMLLLYGYALSFDVKHVRLGLLDESHTKESRELAQKFFCTEYFDPAGNVPGESAIDKYVADNKADAVLVIPRDYARKILLGQDAKVQVIIDGSNSNTATIIVGYANAILQSYSSVLGAKYMNQMGLPLPTSAINYSPRVFYNPQMESMKFLVPGLVAWILMMLVTLIPTISIVREKERGTMELLMLSPATPLQIVLGKTMLYFVLSLGAAVLVLVTSVTLFGVPIRGNIFLLSFVVVLFLMAGLGLGILISTSTDTQAQGYMTANSLSNLPNMLLSGFIFPVSSMPVWLQALSYFFPGRFFIASIRAIMLKGAGFTDIYDQILVLIFFAVAIPLVASWRLNKRRA